MTSSQTSAAGQWTYLSNPVFAGFGGVTSVTMGNGDVESFSYNDRLQLAQLNLMKDSTLLQRYENSYGEVNQSTGAVDTTKNTGRIAKIEGFIGGTTSSPTRQWQQRFSYDSLDRLETSGEYRGDTLALSYKSKFSYDRFGNRFRKAADNTSGSPTTNWVETNQIDLATNRFVNSTTGMVYDDAGNVTSDPKFRGLQYKYDANGRMVWSATTAGGSDSKSVFDGMGQRVATQVGGNWRYLVYDAGGKLIAEYGGAGLSGAGGVTYMLSDHQGSVRAVMNENGWVAGRYDYQPFGEEVGAGVGMRTMEQGFNSDDTTRQKYGMTERDEATGLDHTTWRKYEQNAGRWTSPDPLAWGIGDPQSLNAFSYVGNDPINLADPSGLTPIIPCGSGAQCGWGDVSAGFWGRGDFMNGPRGIIGNGHLRDVPIYIGEAMLRDLAAHSYFPREGHPYTIPHFRFAVEGWQDAIDSAFDRVIGIFKTKPDSKCAQFFGSNAIDVLEKLKKIARPARTGNPGRTPTGISQPMAGGPDSLHGAYRIPTSFTVYINGPFFTGDGPGFGSWSPGTYGAQNLAILHELAHDIIRNSYLIKDDGPGSEEGLSASNTRKIETLCSKEIFDAK